jgi:hypothetical protein
MSHSPPPYQASPPPETAEPAGHDGSSGLETRLWIVRAAKALVAFIYVVVLVELVILALGFALRLFGASTDAAFTRWVYRNVDRAMEPFRGMFPTRVVGEQSVVDTSLLFAMVVYAIVGLGLHALVTWLSGRVVDLRRQQAVLRQQEAARRQQEAALRQQAAARRQWVADAGTARPVPPPDRPVGPGWG